MKKLLLALFLGLIPLAAPASAQKAEDELVEIKGDAPVVLRPDRAYFLLRANMTVSPVFLRIPGDDEMGRYDAARREAFVKAEAKLIRRREDLLAQKVETEGRGLKFKQPIPPVPSLDNFDFAYDGIRNVQTVNMGRTIEKADGERTVLVEARPGNYVIYGLGLADIFQTCLCLGSVSFPAEPGKIVDLGTLLVASADPKSSIPELAGETGFGPSMNGHLVTWAAAIRPANAATHVPAALAGKPITPAAYRAQGKFVAGFSFAINRLAPIPGVLGYDRGKVIDLVDNKVAPNQYD